MIYVGSVPSLAIGTALALTGFCVGVAGSFFGIGGAFLVTPALNIMGFPMAYAIGTDLAHMTGKSVVATLRHRRLGHVDWKAGGLLLIGTLPGVKLGAATVMRLEHLGISETVIRMTYVLLLSVIGLLVLRESLSAQRGEEPDADRALLRRVFLIKPVVSLPVSGVSRISIWGIVGLGLVTGFLASFLGVGGGFIRMPAMLYLVGMPTRVAVGTDILEVMFSGGYGTFLYAQQGRVDVIAALIMLLGASVGSHLGVQATCYVESTRIRLYLAVAILGAALAVIAKQVGLSGISAAILLGLGITLCAVILRGLWIGHRTQSTSEARRSRNV